MRLMRLSLAVLAAAPLASNAQAWSHKLNGKQYLISNEVERGNHHIPTAATTTKHTHHTHRRRHHVLATRLTSSPRAKHTAKPRAGPSYRSDRTSRSPSSVPRF